MKYDFRKIEKRWQERWLKEKVFKASDKPKKKYYQLETFPYPSAAGLHVGHPKGYIAEDIHARFMRMNGHDVLYTMGWDAFGLPTENYAIKVGKAPQEVAAENIKNFKRQVRMFGLSYDWDREINTSSPDYYKWTQWLFIKLFEKGLAYRKKATVNWCPKDQTVLANEQVVNGCCERCGAEVEQKEMEQWFLRITDYADKLLADLNGLDWPESSAKRQKDWIGKSEGAIIEFPISNSQFSKKPNFVLLHGYRGSPEKNFFPWLKKELANRGYKVQAPELPNSGDPRVYDQVEHALKTVSFDENSVILGHSLGTVVALKVLERVKRPVRKTILVGGFTENKFVDDDNFEPQTFDWKFDIKKISKNVGSLLSLRDLTDDAVPQYQPAKLTELFGGRLVDFVAEKPHACAAEEPEVLRNLLEVITVFTTRPDTLFGATYMVLAPEHQLIENFKHQITNFKEVEKYVEKAKHKTELQRMRENDPSTGSGHSKTGVELKGVKAINPATKEEIPVWIADYVLMGYGTGAIMAVPAHDGRDFEFAKKFELPIKEVVVPNIIDKRNPPVDGKKFVERKNVHAIVKDPKTGKYLGLKWRKFNWTTFPMGGIQDGESVVEAAKREVEEETGFVNLKLVKVLDGQARAEYFAAHKDENRVSYTTAVVFELVDHKQVEIGKEERESHDVIWLDKSKLNYENMTHAEVELWNEKLNSGSVYTGEGLLINSGKFDGRTSETAKWEITEFAGGGRKVQYRLRDWSVSRQRYWGVPIPIIYCHKCWEIGNGSTGSPSISSKSKSLSPELVEGQRTTIIDGVKHAIVPVPEKDLPVMLPPLKNYRPKGVPPLASSKEFMSVVCPKCGGDAKRDPETLDTFVDSSWYFLRYTDPANEKEIFDKKKAKEWLPVDLYVIGAEHTTLHLLYARFITKFLHDIGYLNFSEPFLKLRHQGLILGEDGQKMSKSKGNVVNPDEIVGEFGADTVRLYEMFMGPFEQGQPWDPKGVLGMERFLGKIRRYFERWSERKNRENVDNAPENKKSRVIDTFLHKTIKKVGDDIQSFKFNTAISSLMIFFNEIHEEEEAGPLLPGATGQLSNTAFKTHQLEKFIKLLHPFAPHLAQELWSQLGNKTYLDFEKWPEYDEKLIQEEKITLVVQVNGKVRDTFEVDANITEEDAKNIALRSEKVQRYLEGKSPNGSTPLTIKKVVYVRGKLVNIVIE
ncbi:MAG: class I tRNA ligase family protein [Patescibacteria group bacterium]